MRPSTDSRAKQPSPSVDDESADAGSQPDSIESRIVIVSNRLPVSRVKRDGKSAWKLSPGGLVSALRPVLQKWPSTWVGWSGSGVTPDPFVHDRIRNQPVAVSRQEVRDYYEGFSNRTLWPLYHDAIRPPEYHRRWWDPYVEVNRRFAHAAAQSVAAGGIVWVHDYHLQLVPAMIRDLRPDVRIGFFLHIPFPPQELFSQLPWRKQLLEGLLGADVVGFQKRLGAQNFAQLCRRYTSARGKRTALEYRGREVFAEAFPISIDVERYQRLAQSADVRERAQKFREQLGHGRKIVLGVDRLDYTKGIDIRLRAYHELLRSGKVKLDECVLVQVAVPSRERVAEYRELRSQVERLVGEINGEYGGLAQSTIHYLHRNLDIEELVALYMAADVMVVTPFRDGMNLVAKEYIATRVENTGALVLSEFTGSAFELQSALLVNPHDIDGLATTIDAALHLPRAEQRRRMRALRRIVRNNDVFHWADFFLAALQRPGKGESGRRPTRQSKQMLTGSSSQS